MNELNKIYAAILRAWSTSVKDNGALVLNIDNVDFPVKYGEKQVYLPLDELLEKNTIGKVFFHPACEVITSGETEIFKIVRNISSITLMTSFTKYLTVLTNISKKRSKKSLRNDLLEMLEPFRSASEKDIEELSKLFRKMTVKTEDNSHLDNRFIFFKTVKGGRTADNERIYYKCTPTFPFYNEMNKRLNRSEDVSDSTEIDVCGVRIAKSALKLGVHLFRTVFPGIVNGEAYEYDTLRAESARFVSYCGSFVLVADDMNKIQNCFRDDFDKSGVYCIDTSWVDSLDNIPDCARMIPSLDYNNHNIKQETSNNNNGSSYDIQGMMHTSPMGNNNNVNNYDDENESGPNWIQFNGSMFNIKRPGPEIIPMDYTYRGYNIDPYAKRVVHSAVSPTGQVYEYRCSRKGNFLESTSSSNMINAGWNMGMQNYSPMMMSPQQQAQMMMMQQAQAQAAQNMMLQQQQAQAAQSMFSQPAQQIQSAPVINGGFVVY